MYPFPRRSKPARVSRLSKLVGYYQCVFRRRRRTRPTTTSVERAGASFTVQVIVLCRLTRSPAKIDWHFLFPWSMESFQQNLIFISSTTQRHEHILVPLSMQNRKEKLTLLLVVLTTRKPEPPLTQFVVVFWRYSVELIYKFVSSTKTGEYVVSAGTAEKRMYWLQQLQRARREFSKGGAAAIRNSVNPHQVRNCCYLHSPPEAD